MYPHEVFDLIAISACQPPSTRCVPTLLFPVYVKGAVNCLSLPAVMGAIKSKPCCMDGLLMLTFTKKEWKEWKSAAHRKPPWDVPTSIQVTQKCPPPECDVTFYHDPQPFNIDVYKAAQDSHWGRVCTEGEATQGVYLFYYDDDEKGEGVWRMAIGVEKHGSGDPHSRSVGLGIQIPDSGPHLKWGGNGNHYRVARPVEGYGWEMKFNFEIDHKSCIGVDWENWDKTRETEEAAKESRWGKPENWLLTADQSSLKQCLTYLIEETRFSHIEDIKPGSDTSIFHGIEFLDACIPASDVQPGEPLSSLQFLESMVSRAKWEERGVFENWLRCDGIDGFNTQGKDKITAWVREHASMKNEPLTVQHVLGTFDGWLNVQGREGSHPQHFCKNMDRLVAFFATYCDSPSIMQAWDHPSAGNGILKQNIFVVGRLRNSSQTLLLLSIGLFAWTSS